MEAISDVIRKSFGHAVPEAKFAGVQPKLQSGKLGMPTCGYEASNGGRNPMDMLGLLMPTEKWISLSYIRITTRLIIPML